MLEEAFPGYEASVTGVDVVIAIGCVIKGETAKVIVLASLISFEKGK